MTLPGNESCPPDLPGEGVQTDLNAPVTDTAANYLQRHQLDCIEPLCAAGMSPGIVTGVLMRLLAQHFSDPSLIMTETLKQYVWNTDSSLSKMRIVQNTHFDPKGAGMLPALVVKRGDIQSERRIIGDRIDSTDPNEADEGTQSYARWHKGSHRIFCIAGSDGEADDLGLEVSDILTFLSPVLVGYLPFHDFQVVGIGELGVMEDLGNKIGVPVDVQYAYEYAWSVRPIAPRLKKIGISIQ